MKITADTTKAFGAVIDSLVGRNVTLRVQIFEDKQKIVTGMVISKCLETFPPTFTIKANKRKREIFLDEIRGIELI